MDEKQEREWVFERYRLRTYYPPELLAEGAVVYARTIEHAERKARGLFPEVKYRQEFRLVEGRDAGIEEQAG